MAGPPPRTSISTFFAPLPSSTTIPTLVQLPSSSPSHKATDKHVQGLIAFIFIGIIVGTVFIGGIYVTVVGCCGYSRQKREFRAWWVTNTALGAWCSAIHKKRKREKRENQERRRKEERERRMELGRSAREKAERDLVTGSETLEGKGSEDEEDLRQHNGTWGIILGWFSFVGGRNSTDTAQIQTESLGVNWGRRLALPHLDSTIRNVSCLTEDRKTGTDDEPWKLDPNLDIDSGSRKAMCGLDGK